MYHTVNNAFLSDALALGLSFWQGYDFLSGAAPFLICHTLQKSQVTYLTYTILVALVLLSFHWHCHCI
jgi:hypothetical protein